jgi:tetratricopeptide (TPR) repeat protein
VRKADREAEGLRICTLACQLEDEGRLEVAIELYRVAAKLDDQAAWINLSRLLGDAATPKPSAEALYWLDRWARRDPGEAWWNRAMYYRQRGQRRLYFHWLAKSAEAGCEDAVQALSDPTRLEQAWWALDGVGPPLKFRLRGL